MDTQNKQFISTSPNFTKTMASLKQQIKSTKIELTKIAYLHTSVDSALSGSSDFKSEPCETPDCRLRTSPLPTRFETEVPETQQKLRSTYNRHYTNADPVRSIKIDRMMSTTLNEGFKP